MFATDLEEAGPAVAPQSAAPAGGDLPAVIDQMLRDEAHHLIAVRYCGARVMEIAWHYAHLGTDDPNGGRKERNHHVCKQCGRCVLRRMGSPGGAHRPCLYCAGYDAALIPGGYVLAE